MSSPRLQAEYDRLYPLRMSVNARPESSFQRTMSPKQRDAEWEDRLPPLYSVLQSVRDKAIAGFFAGASLGIVVIWIWLIN